jgi:hypothetical protein
LGCHHGMYSEDKFVKNIMLNQIWQARESVPSLYKS